MILAGQFNEYLIIMIVAVLIIAVTLLVYYIAAGRKKTDVGTQVSPNFETKHMEQPIEQVVPEEKVEPVQEAIPEVKVTTEENVSETNIEPVSEMVSDEQKALEEEKTDNSIQTLLNQMQQDLDKSNSESYTESLDRYEDDEEANAIISYKELMKYKENDGKNIILEDKNKEEIKEAIKDTSKEEVKKFKRSEFISPIFGYNEDANVTYREIKRPPKKEKVHTEWESDRMLKDLEDDAAEVIEIDEPREEVKEIDKNDRFLDELVDFRNKLN